MNEMDFLIKDLIFDIKKLKKRVGKLEDNSHPRRDFIVCDKCKQQVKEK